MKVIAAITLSAALLVSSAPTVSAGDVPAPAPSIATPADATVSELTPGPITRDSSPKPKPATRKPAVHLSREEAAARSSRGHDRRGMLPSMYRGRYFHADQESFRRCVGQREGMFHYDVRGGGGGNYYGTYQFSRAFQNGIPYMMAKESRRTHDGLTKEALALRHKPINQWSRYWQDRAFYTVLNGRSKWSGKSHWSGGRWHC